MTAGTTLTGAFVLSVTRMASSGWGCGGLGPAGLRGCGAAVCGAAGLRVGGSAGCGLQVGGYLQRGRGGACEGRCRRMRAASTGSHDPREIPGLPVHSQCPTSIHQVLQEVRFGRTCAGQLVVARHNSNNTTQHNTTQPRSQHKNKKTNIQNTHTMSKTTYTSLALGIPASRRPPRSLLSLLRAALLVAV